MSGQLASVRRALAESVITAAREALGAELPRVVLERPPKVELGDLATPAAFDLARVLRKAPRAIAADLAAALRLPPGVASARVEGAGYLNFFLERVAFAQALSAPPPPREARPGKVVVEHTNINPNKAAHIGHLRNAVLGDVLVRALRFLGHEVEVQNYLDDTGVQVADVVAGLWHAKGVRTPEAAARVIQEAALPGEPPYPQGFAYLCWDLYAEVGRIYEQKPETRAWREEVLHAIEAGHNEIATIASAVVEAVVSAHLATMGRLGIAYDLLPSESEVLHRHFWARAFEMLKASGALHKETEGKHAGCWVLRLAGSEEFAGLEEPDKILVRSNGTVTYTGKDIAYQLWKFGLLGVDFSYSRFAPRWDTGAVTAEEIPAAVRGHTVWRTAPGEGEAGAPSFGRASRVVNVIDARQSYPQKVVREGLRVLAFQKEADASTHFAYEMVALSPAAARELSERFGDEYRLTAEEEKRPFVEMSGRRGLGVKADDLVALLTERSRAEVDRRREESDEGAAQDARAIAIGALRYFLLKFGRNKVIAFDFAEALNFEGDTGPYLQYSLVRAGNIFRKLAERGIPEAGVPPTASWEDDLWAILLEIASTVDVAERAVDSLELSTLARHAFSLAQSFNHFYHRHPIVAESDADLRNRRIAVARLFEREMKLLLDLLGIPEPSRM